MFKIGDKVRVKGTYSSLVGQEGVVTQTDGESCFVSSNPEELLEHHEDSEYGWHLFMSSNSLEKVLSVGDKVRVISNSFESYYDFLIGTTGVIQTIFNNDIDIVSDYNGKMYHCLEKELEKV